MMKRIFLAIVLISVAVMLIACGTTTTTEEGTITTTMTGTEGADSWCPEGGDWTMTVEGAESGEATWKIDRIMTSGQYEGLCHVVYTATSPQGDIVVDYYFNEGGKDGFFEMEMNGQKITQEWHSE